MNFTVYSIVVLSYLPSSKTDAAGRSMVDFHYLYPHFRRFFTCWGRGWWMSSTMPLHWGSTPSDAALWEWQPHPRLWEVTWASLSPAWGRLRCSSFTPHLPSRPLQDRAGGSPMDRRWLRIGTPSLVHQTCPADPCLPIVPKVPPITNLPGLKPLFCLKGFVSFLFLNYSLFLFPGIPMVPEYRPLGYLHTCTSWLSKRGFQSPKTFFQNK